MQEKNDLFSVLSPVKKNIITNGDLKNDFHGETKL